MAKERTLTGNLQDINVVQKARPLSLIRSVPFSFGELKILDTYLSRIDSHDSDHRTVTFTKAEYEELMGIGKTNLATFRKYTKGMLGKVVDVPMPEGYLQFVLFTKAECKKDEYGVPTVTLTCTEEAKRLFFGIEQLGYVRYELRFALALKKQSSYWLYLEILRERYRIEWTVPLEKLRDDILYLKNEQSYKAFKEFKRAVLDPAVAEINEKTDCCIEYETVKRGRTVIAIKFKYTPQERELDGQMTLSEITDFIPAALPEQGDAPIDDQRDLLSDACNNEFTEAEMDMLLSIIVTIPSRRLPPDNATGGSIELRRYHYLAQQYAAMSRYRPKNRLNYLVKMLQQDANEK